MTSFKKPNAYVNFRLAKKINSITAAANYVAQLPSDRLKFRCYLQIRRDAECVQLYRRLGKEQLLEIMQEFYGQPGARSFIQRLLYELEVTDLSQKPPVA